MSKEINDRVKELRLIMQKSQVEFCQLIGIKQGTLSDIERKRINVSPKTVESIVKNLNVESFWMYTGHGDIFTGKNDNVMHGTDAREHAPSDYKGFKNSKAITNVILFWDLVREYDSDLLKSWAALNDLQGLKIDLSNYTDKLYDLANAVLFDVQDVDYKEIKNPEYIKKGVEKLSFLRDELKTLLELKSKIESAQFLHTSFKNNAVIDDKTDKK